MAAIVPEQAPVTGAALAPIFVSVRDAAEMLGIKPWACYQLCDEQQINSRYLKRGWRPASSAAAWLSASLARRASTNVTS